MKKILQIEITKKCYVDCSHCCARANSQGIAMPFRNVVTLMEEVKSLNNGTLDRIGFTGGEPFLYQDKNYTLLDVLLVAKDVSSDLVIQTAGECGYVLENKLEEFAAHNLFENLSIGLSYNLFQKHNPDERIQKSLKTYFKYTDQLFIHIHVTPSALKETIHRFTQSLSKIGFRINIDIALLKAKLVQSAIYSCEVRNKEQKKITINVHPVFPSGRAINAKLDYFPVAKQKSKCMYLNQILMIACRQDGSIYGCCGPLCLKDNESFEKLISILKKQREHRLKMRDKQIDHGQALCDLCLETWEKLNNKK